MLPFSVTMTLTEISRSRYSSMLKKSKTIQNRAINNCNGRPLVRDTINISQSSGISNFIVKRAVSAIAELLVILFCKQINSCLSPYFSHKNNNNKLVQTKLTKYLPCGINAITLLSSERIWNNGCQREALSTRENHMSAPLLVGRWDPWGGHQSPPDRNARDGPTEMQEMVPKTDLRPWPQPSPYSSFGGDAC